MSKASPASVIPFRATPAKDASGRFLPGNNGGSGRPTGSRNKLGEAFVADMLADWQEHGAEAIRSMRESDLVAYVRVVASLMSKHVELKRNPTDDLSDDELASLIAVLRGLACD